jgi:hypothetical protein
MSHKQSAADVNCRTLWLENGEFTLANGATCPRCGDALHVEDAEELPHRSLHLICRNGHLFFCWEVTR